MDYKICSFSGEHALDSELMWGHYANAGKGIVIEVTLNEKYLDSIEKVKYDSTSDLKNYEEILTNKSPVWSYEDEYRYLSNILEGKKVKIGNISKIYFGRPYEHLTTTKILK